MKTSYIYTPESIKNPLLKGNTNQEICNICGSQLYYTERLLWTNYCENCNDEIFQEKEEKNENLINELYDIENNEKKYIKNTLKKMERDYILFKNYIKQCKIIKNLDICFEKIKTYANKWDDYMDINKKIIKYKRMMEEMINDMDKIINIGKTAYTSLYIIKRIETYKNGINNHSKMIIKNMNKIKNIRTEIDNEKFKLEMGDSDDIFEMKINSHENLKNKISINKNLRFYFLNLLEQDEISVEFLEKFNIDDDNMTYDKYVDIINDSIYRIEELINELKIEKKRVKRDLNLLFPEKKIKECDCETHWEREYWCGNCK